MPWPEPLDRMFEALRETFRAGRLAHAYLLVGAPGGTGGEFARQLARLVLCREPDAPCGACTDCRHVGERAHPDAAWVEPESKSRDIRIQNARGLIAKLSQKSFIGGWRVGVVLHADCLNDAAANALLKTLEEPGERTLLLLVTDQPQGLLPTIRSRCQQVALTTGQAVPDGPWRAPLMDLLRAGPAAGPVEALARGAAWKALLDAERKRAEEEIKAAGEELADEVFDARVKTRVIAARLDLLTVMLLWARDLLVCAAGAPGPLHFPADEAVLRAHAARLGYRGARAAAQAVEILARRLERNLPEALAFEAAARAV